MHDDARMISYYSIVADLKKSDQKKPIDNIIPSKYEKSEPGKSAVELYKERKKLFEANRKMPAGVKKTTKQKN